jgi:hypothetical protein
MDSEEISLEKTAIKSHRRFEDLMVNIARINKEIEELETLEQQQKLEIEELETLKQEQKLEIEQLSVDVKLDETPSATSPRPTRFRPPREQFQADKVKLKSDRRFLAKARQKIQAYHDHIGWSSEKIIIQKREVKYASIPLYAAKCPGCERFLNIQRNEDENFSLQLYPYKNHLKLNHSLSKEKEVSDLTVREIH